MYCLSVCHEPYCAERADERIVEFLSPLVGWYPHHSTVCMCRANEPSGSVHRQDHVWFSPCDHAQYLTTAPNGFMMTEIVDTHTHTHTHSNRRTSCLCAGELTVFCDAPDGDKPAECRRTDHASNGQSVVTITAHCAGLHSLHVRYNDVNVLGKVVTCNSVINSSSSRMGHRQGQLHMLLSPTGSVKSTRFT